MRKEISLQEVRHRFVEEHRKQDHAATFKEHRQAASQHRLAEQEAQFNRVYPSIDEQSFPEHLHFLNQFAVLPAYNFRLVVFGPYIYSHLLDYPTDSSALSLLQTLSEFEELEIPQTEELVGVFLDNLQGSCKGVLTIINNLLSNRSYSSCLRDLLIGAEMISKIEAVLHKIGSQSSQEAMEYYKQLYLGILCSMVGSHPAVQLSHFEAILSKITTYLTLKQKQLSMVFSSLGGICGSMSPQKHRAAILYCTLQGLLKKEFYNWQEDAVIIVEYCVKGGAKVDPKFVPIMVDCLDSPIPQLRQRIIRVLAIFQQQSQLILAIQPHILIQRLILCYSSSHHSTQTDLIRLLSSSLPYFMESRFGSTAMSLQLQEGSPDIIPKLLQCIRQGLKGSSVELRVACLDAMLAMAPGSQSEFVRGVVHSSGVLDVIASMQGLQKEEEEKTDSILQLFSASDIE